MRTWMLPASCLITKALLQCALTGSMSCDCSRSVNTQTCFLSGMRINVGCTHQYQSEDRSR
jgi:hypothetical protein